MNDEIANRIIEAISPLRREELEQFISVEPLYAKIRKPLPEFINHIAPQVVFISCDNKQTESLIE